MALTDGWMLCVLYILYCIIVFVVASFRADWPAPIGRTLRHAVPSLRLLSSQTPYRRLADSRVSLEKRVPASALVNSTCQSKTLWDDDWLSCVQGACPVSEAEIVQSSGSGEFSRGLFLSHGRTEVVCTLITSLICVLVQSYKTKIKNYFINIQSYLSL